MRVMNFEVKEFIRFLIELKLAGKESRMRTRFCKLLADRMKQIEDEREELINQFAEHDADGEVVVENDPGTNKQVYKLKDHAGFNREYTVLMREEYVIDETEERQEMLKTIKDIVLNVDMEFQGEEAFVYDRWCEIVEEIE
jgi:hypothetical protein